MIATESRLESKSEEFENMDDQVNSLQESIAQRAFELYQERGAEHGSDQEDWFRAESEILVPLSIKTYDFDDTFITHIKLPVLTLDELQVTVEERRIIVLDKDDSAIVDENGEKKQRLFCKVVLPDRVDWSRAAMSLSDGVLEIEVPKLVNHRSILDID
jgi:HSP20 family molecular chaperone IbpA